MFDPHPIGSTPKTSEQDGIVPNHSENFGTNRNGTESFRVLRNTVERKEDHNITVRQAARMFEAAGVARTERSITNWCQANKAGISRLDAYFDPNEHRYFITQQSIELAIAEERGRQSMRVVPESTPVSEPPPASRSDSENHNSSTSKTDEASDESLRALAKEVMDLKIVNRAKDMFIEQLQKERGSFAEERRSYVDQLMHFNRRVGELEATMLSLEDSARSKSRRLIVQSQPEPDVESDANPAYRSAHDGNGNLFNP